MDCDTTGESCLSVNNPAPRNLGELQLHPTRRIPFQATMLRFSALRTVLARSQSRALQTTSFILPDPATKNGQLTKIVATIGPTSEQAEPLKLVTQAGMKIMRLNFSHATKEEVELRTTNLAAAQPFVKELRAVLLDTKGPEIRSGKLANDTSGHDTIHLEEGKSISLTNDPAEKENGTEQQLYIDYAGLQRCLSPGMKVLLDDGAITLTVTSVGEKIECTIDNTGDLRSRAGVNLPLADTSDLPAMSDKDKADILYGMSMDIDYVAASFVQTAQGVREIRAHIADCAKKLGWSADQPLPLIISKIETAGALQHFDEILKESDGIMVARGDLGVEIPLTQVTNAQKEMVAACNAVGKPVRAMGVTVKRQRFDESHSRLMSRSLWRRKCWRPWPRTRDQPVPRSAMSRTRFMMVPMLSC